MERHHHRWENGVCACGKLQCQAYVLRSPQRSTLCRAARLDGSLFCSNHQYVRTAPVQKIEAPRPEVRPSLSSSE